MHSEKLALIETSFPEPDFVERYRYHDIGWGHACADDGRNGQTRQVSRDGGPAPVLQRVYHGACHTLELQGIEQLQFGCCAFLRIGRFRQSERPGPGAQFTLAR